MNKQRVLIVDDETGSRRGLSELVASWGYETEAAADGAEGLEKVASFRPQVVLADLVMPRMDGMELLRALSGSLGHTAFVMLTAKGSIASAVEAMKQGAFDYLAKPVDTRQLQALLEKATARSISWEELARYEDDLEKVGRFGRLVGKSAPMRRLYQMMKQAGPSSASVLIVGESGTGKELVARMLHEVSPRVKGPFSAINCAAIPESLLESEIFGHEKGAYTGADDRRRGCFELADQGTLFLDEVAEMAATTQVKLLRVLEERSFRRLGGHDEIHVDVRVLAATNRDPETSLKDGKLRQDLYYRLNVFTLELPPLRERIDDIPSLVEHFVNEFAKANNKSVQGADRKALGVLADFHWPGNVRELRNVIERAVIICPRPLIGVEDLPPLIASPSRPSVVSSSSGDVSIPVGTTVEQAERDLILKTLESTGHNKTRAAEILGISLKTLHNKLKKYKKKSEGD
jgi:DNA-binding NtrC family response regulator